jgi:hypothetical protein
MIVISPLPGRVVIVEQCMSPLKIMIPIFSHIAQPPDIARPGQQIAIRRLKILGLVQV